MAAKTKENKTTFSIRVPAKLNEKLVRRAQSIGISKSAVVLSALYKEFSDSPTERDNTEERTN